MRLRSGLGASAAALMLAAVAGAAAAAVGNSEAGWNLARRWCTGCHIVDVAGHGAEGAPAFPTIAREHGKDRAWLRAWLAKPHPPMPAQNLSGAESLVSRASSNLEAERQS